MSTKLTTTTETNLFELPASILKYDGNNRLELRFNDSSVLYISRDGKELRAGYSLMDADLANMYIRAISLSDKGLADKEYLLSVYPTGWTSYIISQLASMAKVGKITDCSIGDEFSDMFEDYLSGMLDSYYSRRGNNLKRAVA